ncbi:hypothetical protein M0805_009851 [Coniferiporia weirii]|nr:hypothetical protein M0805_009851 [Coniferiporia weirii]
MGVKSLWSLLTPVGRPVMLETVEGKSMAIDSSIWIYQFQATMRDKDGRGLVNAHVLGFLRRICKLLFYGIKPVFVFDGGAPALKRMTISERKKKKSGAAESHARIAEKLLAAQMRKEALNHAQSSSGALKGKSKIPQGPATINEDTVYLGDLDGSTQTPAKGRGQVKESPISSAKKSRWQDHDPYRLPEVDMEAVVAKATSSSAPDPRLATEDELHAFIEMMRPEDLDFRSPAFRELPAEVQYEIIGDLRLKSRHPSHKRLQEMLRHSRTDLDFSKAQIQNLKQRNALTQRLLDTTDSMGKANISIPIRIASERNREYVLVKNEGEDGGWVLGIRDDGTQDKPIEIDQEDSHVTSDQDSDKDDDMDMEEVSIPQMPVYDSDLRDYQRGLTLAGVEKRQAAIASKGRTNDISPSKKKRTKVQPLFIPDEGDEDDLTFEYVTDDDRESIEDIELTAAMQASLEDQEADQIRKAIEESRKDGMSTLREPSTPNRSASSRRHETRALDSTDSEDDLYVPFTPSRLDTALRFANTGRDHERGAQPSSPALFSRPLLLVPSPSEERIRVLSDSDEDMEEVVVIGHPSFSPPPADVLGDELQPAFQPTRTEKSSLRDSQPLTPVRQLEPTTFSDRSVVASDESISALGLYNIEISKPEATGPATVHTAKSEEDVSQEKRTMKKHSSENQFVGRVESDSLEEVIRTPEERHIHTSALGSTVDTSPHGKGSRITSERRSVDTPSATKDRESTKTSGDDTNRRSITTSQLPEQLNEELSDEEAWFRPTPPGSSGSKPDANTAPGDEDFDAANEMDVHEEAGEFARFAAQVKGKDLDSVRHEIDEEIRQLHQQRKVAMRDSEDVTQAMIAQIMTMLRLFGIPYITAPMEAEAQCAALVELGLVDGIITDDSDVFLFGGARVFKNMFNQAKTVECFLLADLARELGLDRGTLIRLAYLLGSDYVEGLPGVGPVVAMELLRDFPGDDGLHKFKDWWLKVQMGRDKDSDNLSTFRKRFKKRFKNLYLPNDWPNPAVRDAYYHPVVDSSDEGFKWGLPDLDGLREFFKEELSWNPSKVDELLLPIIHKMNKRGQEAAANRQGTLNDFFSVSLGNGAAEPRKNQAYASRRLQALVTEHRKAQKQRTGSNASTSRSGSTTGETSGDEAEAEIAAETRPTRKRKRATRVDEGEGNRDGDDTNRGKGKGSTSTRGQGRGRRARVAAASRAEAKRKRTTKPKSAATVTSGSEDEFVPNTTPSGEPVREIALRARIKPRPAYRGANGSADVDGTSDTRKQRKGSVTAATEDASASEGSEYKE